MRESRRLSQSRLAAAGRGWDGDRILLLGSDDPEPMLVWYTTWDTPEDAKEFTRAAIDMLRLRHPGAEEELREGGLGIFLEKDAKAASVTSIHRDVILMERVPSNRWREIALAFGRAVKEELRVHREPFQSGK